MFFFFNDTATTEIYTLSLHDALPICAGAHAADRLRVGQHQISRVSARILVDGNERRHALALLELADRKSTRLNSSHANISYAVFCLKKKKNNIFTNSFTYHPNRIKTI